MPKAYKFSLIYVAADGDTFSFDEVTVSLDRVQRAMRVSAELNCLFQLTTTSVSASEFATMRELEKSALRRHGNWSYGLPSEKQIHHTQLGAY